MSATNGIDRGRIERLRNPERYEQVDPNRIWNVIKPPSHGVIADVGAGVGFVTLPFARSLPQAKLIACDLLPEMLTLLAEAVQQEELDNVVCQIMETVTRLPLADHEADLVIMVQVHHELENPQGLMDDCFRVMNTGGKIVIIDWKDRKADGTRLPGRRVSAETICAQLSSAGFIDIEEHELYENHHCLVGTNPREF